MVILCMFLHAWCCLHCAVQQLNKQGRAAVLCREEDPTDLQSRHKGKLHTEKLLQERNVNFTSIRPVYIYGPLNYNPVEEFFFHRLSRGRPVCVPNSGMQVTQLGHVKDLADAFVKCLGNPKASQQIFNISGATLPGVPLPGRPC